MQQATYTLITDEDTEKGPGQTETAFVTEKNQMDQVRKAILRAQRCQRNWDLSRQLTEDQLELILTAATQAPTKQNIPFYEVIAIQNREMIEKIYNQTFGENAEGDGGQKNPQVLANTLLAFVEYDFREAIDSPRNPETTELGEYFKPGNDKLLNEDRMQAIGVAAGFVNVTANMMGLRTGCCKCMDGEAVREILGTQGYPRLLMGVGFPDTTRPRRAHHVNNHLMRSYSKEIAFRVIR